MPWENDLIAPNQNPFQGSFFRSRGWMPELDWNQTSMILEWMTFQETSHLEQTQKSWRERIQQTNFCWPECVHVDCQCHTFTWRAAKKTWLLRPRISCNSGVHLKTNDEDIATGRVGTSKQVVQTTALLVISSLLFFPRKAELPSPQSVPRRLLLTARTCTDKGKDWTR